MNEIDLHRIKNLLLILDIAKYGLKIDLKINLSILMSIRFLIMHKKKHFKFKINKLLKKRVISIWEKEQDGFTSNCFNKGEEGWYFSNYLEFKIFK